MKHVLLLSCLLACIAPVIAAPVLSTAGTLAELPVASGQFIKSPDTVVCAKPFNNAYKMPQNSVEFSINRRFTQFTCVIALHDGAPTRAAALVGFYLDGREVARRWIKALDEGIPVTFSVTNAVRLGIRIDDDSYDGEENVRIIHSELANEAPPANPSITPLIAVAPRYGILTLIPYAKVAGNTLNTAYFVPRDLAYDLNKQFTTFSCIMALEDAASTKDWLKVGIYIDGTEVETREITVQSSQRLSMNVQNAVRMELKFLDDQYSGEDHLMLINPILNRGNAPAFLCDVCGKAFGSKLELDNHAATVHVAPPPVEGTGNGETTVTRIAAAFVVDPKDIDQLAQSMRRQIDAKPEIKERLAAAKIAISTFKLVDIASPSVADNVAEDLSTSLLKSDFTVIERGQLDKVLKELKIQDSGMIDPDTALKIGQLTGCDIVMVGSISDRGQFIVINARFLETATGKTIAAERVEGRKIEIRR
ncbi:MAG: CsgG/HfaB family protein [Armatimonadota bacterium]